MSFKTAQSFDDPKQLYEIYKKWMTGSLVREKAAGACLLRSVMT